MSKRLLQEGKPEREERVGAKSKPVWNLVSGQWVRVHLTARGCSKHKDRIRTSPVREDPWRRGLNEKPGTNTSTGKLVAETTKKPFGTTLSHHNFKISGKIFAFLRKSIQMYDGKWVNRETICRTLTSTLWSGENLCLQQWKLRCTLDKIIKRLRQCEAVLRRFTEVDPESKWRNILDIYKWLEHNSMDENNFAARQSSQSANSKGKRFLLFGILVAEVTNIHDQ